MNRYKEDCLNESFRWWQRWDAVVWFFRRWFVPKLWEFGDDEQEWVVAWTKEQASTILQTTAYGNDHRMWQEMVSEYGYGDPQPVDRQRMRELTYKREDGSRCSFAEEYDRLLRNRKLPFYFAGPV